ncbi:MAG: lysylphosphatidylglycerol synthase transmembrane domain-containing protein [Vicinamibacterales bacterium]
MRSNLRSILVVILAVALLAYFFRHADLRDVAAELARGRLDLLVAALGTTMLTYVLRAFRWRYMLESIGPARLADAFRTTVIGFAASFLLPARAGEFLRPYLMARRSGWSATAGFATIILERVLDMVTVLVLFAAFLLTFDPSAGSIDEGTFRALEVGGLVATAAALGVLAVFFVLAGRPAAVRRLSGLIGRAMPTRVAQALSRPLEMFVSGLAVVRQPRRFLVTMALSFPLWLCIAAGIWLASRAFSIEIPLMGSFLLMAILVVGVAVPTPGAVGGYHEAFRVGATAFYSVSNERAVGAAIVLHAISFVPVTLLGIAFMMEEGLTFGRMRRLAREAGAEEGIR